MNEKGYVFKLIVLTNYTKHKCCDLLNVYPITDLMYIRVEHV